MCGIAGYAVAGPPLDDELGRMLDMQRTRGPDDRGVWNGGFPGDVSVGLGHNRLSVIELSSAGHQPMASPNGRWLLSYNGEIYNYLELREQLKGRWDFRGKTDTEVVIAAYATWGRGAWSRLNGMFAVALMDTVDRRLVLSRSHFGSKPLHYSRHKRGWLLASTPDAIAAVNRAPIDVGYVARGVHTWMFDGDGRSPFEGVVALSPGSEATFRLDSLAAEPSIAEWYDLGEAVQGARASLSPPGGELRVLKGVLQDSVRLRLRSDVPVGVSLSGGLDSTAIAYLMSLGGDQPVAAYSYRWGREDPESADVDRLRRDMGAGRLSVEWVDPPSRAEVPADLEAAIRMQGAPLVSLSAMAQARVFRAARNAGTTVMLGGQGADEVLMGYRKYQVVAARQSLALGRYPDAARRLIGVARALKADNQPLASYTGTWRRYGRTRRRFSPFSSVAEGATVPLRDAHSLSLFDLQRGGLPTLLRYEDRNSMGASVESRLPFLDHRLVEMALALPTDLKVRDGFGKWPLRRIMSSHLPDRICWARYKRGFEPGNGVWLGLGAGEWLRDRLQGSMTQLRDAGLALPGESGSLYPDEVLARDPARMAELLAMVWMTLWWDRTTS